FLLRRSRRQFELLSFRSEEPDSSSNRYPPRRLARVCRQGREVMRCSTVRKELTALVDGALAPRQTAKVRLHLDRCPACRAELATIERIVRLERAALPSALPELSLGFRTRL